MIHHLGRRGEVTRDQAEGKEVCFNWFEVRDCQAETWDCRIAHIPSTLARLG